MFKRVTVLVFLFFAFSVQKCFATDFFTQGKIAFDKKDYRSANIYFVKALTQNPNNATWRYYYAQTLTYLKNYEQAKKEYGYVILLEPSSLLADYAQQSIAYIDEVSTSVSPKTSQKVDYDIIHNDNYLPQALTTSGELITWDFSRLPLKVYIDNSYGAKQIALQAVKSALSAWMVASNGVLKIQYVEFAEEADLKIVFKGIAKKTENQTLGYTRHTSVNNFINNVEVVLYTLGPNYRALSQNDIYNVALHEFGHMLGIWGHSDNPDDVMYALYNTNTKNATLTISQRDKNTLVALYSIDKNSSAGGINSIDKVLGNKNSRMDTKIQQGLDYIKTAPGNPLGYVNLANTYKSMGKEYDAIAYYKKALEIDGTNVAANVALGEIFFTKNDLRSAEPYYKTLIKTEPQNPAHYCNLASLYLNNKRYSLAKTTLANLFYRNRNAKNEGCVQQILKKLP